MQSQSVQIMLALFLRFNIANQTRSKSISILPKPFLLDVWVFGPYPRAQPVPPGLEHPGTSPGFLLSQLEVLRGFAGSPMPFPSVYSAHLLPGRKQRASFSPIPCALQPCREDEGTRLSQMSLLSAS